MLTSSTTKISVFFQIAFVNLFFFIFDTKCSMVPFPNPIPAHECRVFALQFKSTAAHPVSAVTCISLKHRLACSYIFLIKAVFPEPPGPVINIL